MLYPFYIPRTTLHKHRTYSGEFIVCECLCVFVSMYMICFSACICMIEGFLYAHTNCNDWNIFKCYLKIKKKCHRFIVHIQMPKKNLIYITSCEIII